ncbi:Dna2/Cas4 domain-containing protein [bacterium]|nr:Dna2/Cas4 domain-containing protein [bacterium]
MIEIAVAIAIIVIAIVFITVGQSRKTNTGIDEEIIYSDLDHFAGGADLLKAPLGTNKTSSPLNGVVLCGKPDNIGSSGVPYEFKSGKSPKNLYDGYRLQVLAYGVILEKLSGKMPPYGVVRFKDGKEFKVEYTRSNIKYFFKNLYSLLDVIRGKRKAVRNHENINKCKGCEYFTLCSVKK